MHSKIDELLESWEDQAPLNTKQDQRVMVACSGGIDSTVLLRLICELAKRKKNLRVGLIHVNFKLRGSESEQDETFVLDLANRLSIPAQLLRVNESDIPKSGVQEWARKLRYEEFNKWAKRGWLIAIGHNRDDLAENLLLRASRGAGVGQLAGMCTYRTPFWRPLLQSSRQDIENMAEIFAQCHREDLSNAKINYARNRVRHQVLPVLEDEYPGASKRLASLALEAQCLAQWCEKELMETYGISHKGCPLAKLTNLPAPVAMMALGLMIKKAQGRRIGQLSRQLLSELLERIQSSEKSWCFDLPGGLVFKVDNAVASVWPASQNQKGARYQQHRRNLGVAEQTTKVGPASQVEVWLEGAERPPVIGQNDGALSKRLILSSNSQGMTEGMQGEMPNG